MQEAFLEAFFQAGAPSERFYLSGGTALSAYYLHHRYSDDLDLFTRDQDALSVGGPLVEQLVARLGLGISSVNRGDYYVGFFLVGDLHPDHPLKKVELIWDSPPYFDQPRRFGSVMVDSLLNIAVNKLTALTDRPTPELKDFVDLYFILRDGRLEFQSLLALAKQKVVGFEEFRLAAILSQVSSLAGLIEYLRRYMVYPLSIEELERFCLRLSDQLFDLYPPPQGLDSAG